MPLNLPNTLTLLRVAAIPVLVVLFYIDPPFGTQWCAAVFVLAAFTDWLDGWLARRSGQSTAFGAFLDPVADKLIVATTLVLLTERFDDLLITLAACVVIGREIVVSALREWMAQLGRHASDSAWHPWADLDTSTWDTLRTSHRSAQKKPCGCMHSKCWTRRSRSD